MGIEYFTFTGSPFIVPGFHFGIDDTTLIASALRDSSTPWVILGSEIEPSSKTTNLTITLPCISFFLAFFGYFRL